MKAMRVMGLIVALLMVISVLPGKTVQALPAPYELDPDASYVPGEILISLEEGLSTRQYRARASALASSVGAAVTKQYENLAVLSFSPDADVTSLAAQLMAMGTVTYAQPNYIYTAAQIKPSQDPLGDRTYTNVSPDGSEIEFTPQDIASMRRLVKKNYRTYAVPSFPNEMHENSDFTWAWQQIRTDIIWSETALSPMICLLDTGVDDKHPDLYGRVVRGYDFVNMDSLPNDDNGHGTWVAGLMVGKMNSGKETALGVSNGKVLAVKVADSTGSGTSWDISAGVRNCANNIYVKIINMSMGTGHPDRMVYQNIDYAINMKGKLVVAAAGDEGRSSMGNTEYDREVPPTYPAGWADMNVGWTNDGYWVEYNPDGNLDTPDNGVFHGLISVSSSRIRYWDLDDGSEFLLWVDTNENGVKDQGENQNQRWGCLKEDANYGRWVTLIVPGSDIYSSTPVSYAFRDNWYFGWPSGYAWGGGTSASAGYASGAAARLWSINPTWKPRDIKQRLVDAGMDLSTLGGRDRFLVDESVSTPAQAFWDNDSHRFDWVMNDPDRWDDEWRAPFCYPTTYDDRDGNLNPFQAPEDMSQVRLLNVAMAMNRYSLAVSVRDATNGLPLEGATVTVKNKATGILADKIVIKANQNNPYQFLTNLPWKVGSTYVLQVAKTGYTYYTQTVDQFKLNPDDYWGPGGPGWGWITSYSHLSIPPANSNFHVVLDWLNYANANLDFYAWLPKGPVNGLPEGAIIQRAPFAWDYLNGSYQLYPDWGWAGDVWIGTLQNPISLGGTENDWAPYARHNFADDWANLAPMESITVRTKDGKAWYPGDYTFIVGDYSRDYGGGLANQMNALDIDSPDFADPVVRVWSGGVLKKTVRLSTATDPDCYDDSINADFWKAVVIKGATIITPQDCGTGEWPRTNSTIFPYP